MRRTLKLLGLIGVATAAGAAAAKQMLPTPDVVVEPPAVGQLPNVTLELRHALQRFEERFGA